MQDFFEFSCKLLKKYIESLNHTVYNDCVLVKVNMTASDMIRELREKQKISLAELCSRIGQTPQNFNKKEA